MKRILASLGILVASGTFAHAGVDFCNQFKHPIFVAVAYDSGGGDMVSTGWEKAESGECITDPFKLSVKKFYYRAETDWIKTDKGKEQWTWGSDDQHFNVIDDTFTFHHADAKRKGARLEGFTASLVSQNDNPISETVTFESDGIHTTQHSDN